VLDYELPDGNGIELIEELASAGPHTPVVLVTGKGDESTASRAFLAGADGYVVKDNKLEPMLLAAVNRALERSRSAKKLRETESVYEFVTGRMDDVIWTLDLDLKTTYVTPSIEKVLGFTVEERMEQTAQEQLTPASFELAALTLAEELRREEDPEIDPERRISIELEFYHKDGTVVCLDTNVNGIRDGNGELVGIYGVSRDITERRQARLELERSERKYRTLYESSLDGIVNVEMDGHITEANQAYLHMLGYTLEEVRGLTYQQLTPEKWHVMEQGIVDNEILTRGYSDVYEKEYRRKDGSVFPIAIRTWLIKDEHEESTGMWAIVRDITERKKTEEELRQINIELAGFAHAVSHDLKSPLTAIGMASEMLPKIFEKTTAAGAVPSELEELVSIIARNVQRSGKLIEELLLLAEAGQAPSYVVEVDVGNVVMNVLEENEAQIAAADISIEVTDDLGQVLASPAHVYQLFSNLVRNAIKHNTSESPKIGIFYTGDDEEGGHRYLVRDNGSGIPDEDLERIFIPFFKGSSGDTGIGLSLVQKIVNLYGGEIRAYDDYGACFEFSIRDYLE
jgi:PAS domain S-box-containing protein